MSSKERQTIIDIFQQQDSNQDGVLSMDEVVAGAGMLGVETNAESVQSWLKTYHKQEQYMPFDSLRFASFILRNKFQKQADDEVKLAFAMFDQNGDGFVSFDELKAIYVSLGQALSDEELNEMLARADSDGDGRISFDEFKSIQ